MWPESVEEQSWLASIGAELASLWGGLDVSWRMVLIGIGAAVVLALVVLLLRALGAVGRRYALRILTTVAFIGAVGFGWWTQNLPELRGTHFVLWHQLVRVGAALCAAAFVLGGMVILLPKILNVLERRGFVSQVATRYIRTGRSGFLTAMSVLSILGVGISAFALCMVLSILGGFGEDLKTKILGNSPQVLVDAKGVNGFADWENVLEKVRGVDGVVAATPVAGGQALTSSALSQAGVVIHGINPATATEVIDVGKNIEVGSLEYLNDPELLANLPEGTPIGIGPGGEFWLKGPPLGEGFRESVNIDLDDPSKSPETTPKKAAKGLEETLKGAEETLKIGKDALKRAQEQLERFNAGDPLDTFDEPPPKPQVLPGIVIGRELARTLSVHVSETVTLLAPLGDLGPMGIIPRSRDFRIAAIFYSGMYEFDAAFVYTELKAAEDFLELGDNITAIYIKTDNPDRVTAVTEDVRSVLAGSGLRIRNWQELNRNLFSALKLEKLATFIILAMIIMVASFCIICTLLLMVAEKSKEIAIMKALGATNSAVLRIFMAEGAFIGGIGTVFGVVLGLVACLGLEYFGVRVDPEVYYVDHLPVNVDPVDYAVVAVAAILISTLMTIIPAWSASRLRPVDGLRYE